jgi:hypothetical protein
VKPCVLCVETQSRALSSREKPLTAKCAKTWRKVREENYCLHVLSVASFAVVLRALCGCGASLALQMVFQKIENHIAKVAIHAVYYNVARIHKSLRITPAMAADISDHVWSLEEIVLLSN